MSKQTNMASSEEEIREGTGKKRAGWIFVIIGIIVSLIGYVFYDFYINHYRITESGRKVLLRTEHPFQLVGLFVILIGIIIISIGILKKVYSRN